MKSQKGNMAIIASVIIIVVAIGAYLIFHKSPKTTASSTTPTSTTSTTPSPTPAASTPAASSKIVQTKTASNVGQYLADSNGNALYTYGSDTTGVSNCSGSCLYSWPVYSPTGSTKTQTNVTIITRSDGTKQYAYKGMPLYTFTSDSVSQVTGDGVSNFHIAKP